MARRLVATVLLITFCASLLVAQAKPQRVRVSKTIMQNMVIRKVPPAYPEAARKAHVQGEVVLQVTISKTGDVENIQTMSGDPVLVAPSIDAVKQWKYRPYSLNGEPVEVETQVTVNFTLADKAPEGIAGDAPRGIAPGQPGGIADSSAPPAAQTAVQQRVHVSSGVASGLIVKKIPPLYPEDARRQHIQGTVLLNATIDTQGNIASLDVTSGPAELAPAAIEAVRQWKYRPYLLNGTPVDVETQVQVNFTLAD